MNLIDRFLLAAMIKRETGMTAKIVSIAFLLLCALGTLFVGVITGEFLWLLLGTIWTVMFLVALVICIVINIRSNTSRW